MISQLPEGLERDSGQECQMLLKAQLRNGLKKMPTGFHNLEITDDQIRTFQRLVNYFKALSSRT